MHDEFISAMCAAGLAPVKPPRFVEGRLERFRVEGDKAGSLNGWAVAHFSPVRVLVFGSWKTGEKHTWHANGDKPSPAEAEALRKQLAAVRAQHAEEQAKVRPEQYSWHFASARSPKWQRRHPRSGQQYHRQHCERYSRMRQRVHVLYAETSWQW